MYRLLVENRITVKDGNYKCFLCGFQMLKTYEEIIEHIETPCHKEFVEPYKWDKLKVKKSLKNLMNFTEMEYQKLVNNGVVYKKKNYTCYCCTNSKLATIFDHLDGKKHRNNYKNSYIPLKNDKEIVTEEAIDIPLTNDEEIVTKEAIDIPLTNDKEIVTEEAIDSTLYELLQKEYQLCKISSLHRSNLKANLIQYNKRLNIYTCDACDMTIKGPLKTSEHMIESSHLENLKECTISNLIKTQKNPEIKNVITGKDLFYYCKKCDLYLTLNEIFVQCHCLLHLCYELPIVYGKLPNFNFDIIEVSFTDGNVNIKCLLCDKTIDGSDKKLAEHLISRKHSEKSATFSAMPNTKYNNVDKERYHENDVNNYVSNFISINNFCTICYTKTDLNGRDRFQKIKPVQKSNIENVKHSHFSIKENINRHKCFLCNRPFPTVKSLYKHFSLSTHRHKVAKFSFMIQDPAFKNIKISDLMKKQVQKNHSNKKKPDVEFPYNKDVLVFGERYITKCLETGNDNIYDFDYDGICQFRLGASLTYKSKSEILCLVCNYKFPNHPLFLYEHLQHEVHIINLRAMKTEDRENQNQISFLDLAKSYMIQDESDETITCFICNTIIPNYDDEIKTHMKSDEHISKIEIQKTETGFDDEIRNILKMIKDIWYYADRFNCNVCNIQINREISFVKHLEEPDHLEKVKVSDVENKINVCFVCSLCWYGSSDYSKHYSHAIHIKCLKNCNKSSKRPSKYKQAINLLKFINENVSHLITESNKIFKEKGRELMLLESIVETAKHKYPNARAYAFGSRSSYLGFSTSDVDVFLDCENIYNNVGSKEISKKYINQLANEFLSKKKNIWKNDGLLLQPRVPIMKLYNKALGLKCDISFLSGLGVEKSKLIRTYVVADIDSHQIVRSLILILKRWFAFCDLYGPQAINAYAITWYAIFYLQTIGILPSVHQLIRMKNESNIVDGWQCGFPETIPKININYTIEELLKGFFAYYYHFDYQTNLVCPLLGKVLKKRTFANVNDIPEEMEIYKQRLGTIELFRFDSPMCIQDPVDLSQNITKAITKIQLRDFREYCLDSYNVIAISMSHRTSSNQRI